MQRWQLSYCNLISVLINIKRHIRHQRKPPDIWLFQENVCFLKYALSSEIECEFTVISLADGNFNDIFDDEKNTKIQNKFKKHILVGINKKFVYNHYLYFYTDHFLWFHYIQIQIQIRQFPNINNIQAIIKTFVDSSFHIYKGLSCNRPRCVNDCMQPSYKSICLTFSNAISCYCNIQFGRAFNN